MMLTAKASHASSRKGAPLCYGRLSKDRRSHRAALIRRWKRRSSPRRGAHRQRRRPPCRTADLSSVAGVHPGGIRSPGAHRCVDIIVSNVGGASAPAGGFAVLSDEEWQRALDINLLAAVRLIARSCRGWLERTDPGPRAHHVDSAPLPLFESTIAYAAAKAALANYSKALSKEWAEGRSRKLQWLPA